MKILIIGSNYNWSIERIYKRELLRLGYEVRLLPVQNWFYDFYYKSILHKIIVRIGLIPLEKKIQKRILSELDNETYDLIWVFKGMEINFHTLVKLKKITKRIINFNPDNPFIFSGKGSGNKNVTNCISLYDEHFTYDHLVKKKIELEYKVNCTLVPFGIDPEIIPFEQIQPIKEIDAICFLGNPDSYRVDIIKKILENGLSIHVYGNGWSKFLRHPNLTIRDAVYNLEFYQILRLYKVQLNIMRVHNLDSHNMRSIEIPGCGGIMLAPKTKDHEEFFTEGKEVFFYTSIHELVLKANLIFQLSDKEISQIRESARRKVDEKFKYSELVTKFLNF
jgi:spore maturation protein CgeB